MLRTKTIPSITLERKEYTSLRTRPLPPGCCVSTVLIPNAVKVVYLIYSVSNMVYRTRGDGEGVEERQGCRFTRSNNIYGTQIR